MRLTRFRVQGFKNIVAPIALDKLDQINVLHGENNVGKSNVLESMLVYFWALGELAEKELGTAWPIPWERLGAIFARPESLFNLHTPRMPMQFEAEFEIENTILPSGRLLESGRVRIDVEIARSPHDSDVLLTARNCQFDDHDSMPPKEPPKGYTGGDWPDILGWLSGTHRVRRASRFALLHTDRRLQGNLGEMLADVAPGSMFSSAFERVLYDARDTTDTELGATWRRFRKVMEHFGDVLDGGRPNVVNPSDTVGGRGRPFLVVDRPDGTRIPADQLGSGAQQLIALIGQMLTANANFLVIEEPELNLRYDLQLRLLEVLQNHVVGQPGAPAQVFLTSHSAAFETGATFYAMRQGADGPEVSREDRNRLTAYLSAPSPELTAVQGDAPAGWLSSEALVKVPPFAVERLGAHGGAAVVFRDGPGKAVELLNASDPAAWPTHRNDS